MTKRNALERQWQRVDAIQAALGMHLCRDHMVTQAQAMQLLGAEASVDDVAALLSLKGRQPHDPFDNLG